MSKDKVIMDASVNTAIKNFHSSKDGEGWIVFGYSGETTIVVIAEGSGGLSEASKHFIDSDARFALLRKEHKVEISRTTKFAFIDYTPSTIIPKRKALLSTHKGQIKDLLKPYHVAAEWSSPSEIDENEILSKIGMASGTQNNVTTKEVYSHKATGLNAAANATTAAVASGSFVPNSVTKERELKLIDEAGIKAAIADVRSDSTATDWCFIGYSGTDFTSLHLKGKGEGGIPALLSAIESDDAVSYSFFRTTEKIDKTVAVKFGFIKIIPANAIPSVKRGLISTHQGFIQKIFEPFHVSFDVQTVKDISPEIITDKITSYSGTKSHVVNDESKKPTPAHILHGTKPDVAPPKALVPVNHGSITIADEHVWKEAIKAVRDAKNENINYLIATYSAKNTIALLKTGYGTVDDLKESFESENANWGIIRITDIIDNKSITTKFAYIRWLPSSVPATKRGAIGALKGAIDSLFSPYHVDAFAERLDDVNHQLIVDKVGSASGSKSHVK